MTLAEPSFPVPAVPKPIIDRLGLTLPTFADVHSWLQEAFRTIYGEDIYITEDSQDGQLIGTLVKSMHDYTSEINATYQAFSPSTAQGEGLSRVVKINGIRRRRPTKSSADLRIVGWPGTVIPNGVAEGVDGQLWDLPANTIIPPEAEGVVTGIARSWGEITAPPNTIVNIQYPVRGWQSVTNPEAAIPGAPIEFDPELRVRQSISTEIPAKSLFDGLLGAVASVPGVSRYRAYENEDWGENLDGLPPRSITIVADGGDPEVIADVIRRKKPAGAVTFGNTFETVLDDYGIPKKIWFSRSRQVPIKVFIPIRPLHNFTTIIAHQIRNAVVSLIMNLRIGDDVILTDVVSKATLGDNPMFDVVRPVTIGRVTGQQMEADLVLEYDERATLTTDDVILTQQSGEVG